jgi:hypothetical protein
VTLPVKLAIVFLTAMAAPGRSRLASPTLAVLKAAAGVAAIGNSADSVSRKLLCYSYPSTGVEKLPSCTNLMSDHKSREHQDLLVEILLIVGIAVVFLLLT